MPPKRKLDNEGGGRERKARKVEAAREIQAQVASTSMANSTQSIRLDSAKGLPASLDIEKFVETRGFEIRAMEAAHSTASASSSHRVWQTLPRHLRRRAASHDVRRVPVRLREKARAEMDSGKAKSTRKSLSNRGKTKQLTKTESYLRRQRDKVWLETHIWHAKRMHMVNLWGYRLAYKSTEKAFRPSHRASIRSSILHDSSYMGTIEIVGKEELLLTILTRCCDAQSAGPGAVRYSSGSRLCETHLYEPDKFPFYLVAPVDILWKPKLRVFEEAGMKQSVTANTPVGNLEDRVLWIRVHPAAFEDAIMSLKTATSLVLDSHRQSNGGLDLKVEIADLRGQVNSFELVGPRSGKVIHQALSLVSEGKRPEIPQFWNSLETLQTPGAVPRGMVVGMTVHDPRLSFPPNQTNQTRPHTFSNFPSAPIALTNLWSEKVRSKLISPRFKNQDINRRREQQPIPGTRLSPLRDDDRIPLLLIQRTQSPPPPSSPCPSLHGWTLIIPRGWAMSFLNSLTFAGTRVGGLRERETQARESGAAYFPTDYPTTPSYNLQAELRARETKLQWERKPPAKRPNWKALGTLHPWKPNWEALLGLDVSEDEEGLLPAERDGTEVSFPRSQPWLFRGSEVPSVLRRMMASSVPDRILLDWINTSRVKRGIAECIEESQIILSSALVPVLVNMHSKGVPEDHSHMYCMTDEEILQWTQKRETATEDEEPDISSPLPGTLVGYVTSGGFSLSVGGGLAIGHVPLVRMLELLKQVERMKLEGSFANLVKVRQKDGEVCRAATLELIAA